MLRVVDLKKFLFHKTVHSTSCTSDNIPAQNYVHHLILFYIFEMKHISAIEQEGQLYEDLLKIFSSDK
jgi:hypothetical protein